MEFLVVSIIFIPMMISGVYLLVNLNEINTIIKKENPNYVAHWYSTNILKILVAIIIALTKYKNLNFNDRKQLKKALLFTSIIIFIFLSVFFLLIFSPEVVLPAK